MRTRAAWLAIHVHETYDDASCGSPLFAQELRRDVLGRARTVQTRWGNPARVSTAEPWRGYEYSSEGQLTAVYEHEGLAESIGQLPSTLAQITNSDVANLVANHNNDTAEPVLAVDWVREDAVGGLLSMDERGTGVSRWHHQGDRNPGQQLGTIELDGATFAITHDEQGRVIDGAGSTFVYGPRGRLVSITRGNLTEDFAYDAAGRLTRLEDGKTQNIVHDGDQMIAAMEPGLPTPQWEAVWGGQTDQMLEFERFELGINGLFIPVTDHRNSIVGWWDADTRQMRHILEYTPLGRVRLLAPDGTERCVEEGSGIDCVKAWDPPPFGFASAYRSEVSGISYMRNRWYAPKLGQFLTHDPLGYLDGYNPYTYGVGDPINYWDPYGLAGKFMAGLRLGFLDKVGQLAGDVWKGLNWLSESLFSDPINRKIKDASLLYDLLGKFADNPEALLKLLPFNELGEEGLLAKEALNQGRNEDAGRHLFKAVVSAIMDVGPTVILGKLAEAAGLNKLLKKLDPRGLAGRIARVCSFTEGTPVLMCDGTYKEIQDVVEGDMVLARDETTGEVACQEVVDPYANPNRSIIILELADETGHIEAIETTDNHPFFVLDQGWTRVDELQLGDLVPSADGGLLTVVSAMWTDRIETVYNFGVDEFHTYFVGESGAWVHNCFQTPWAEMSSAQRKHLKHVYQGAINRGWNVPPFKEGQADRLRTLLNTSVDWVERNAQTVQHATNLDAGVVVASETAQWVHPTNGLTYWVTRNATSRKVLSVGAK